MVSSGLDTWKATWAQSADGTSSTALTTPLVVLRLEQLCRYGLRPAVAAERLQLAEDGRLIYHMKRTFSDGTNQVVFTPDALLRRLVALIPRPRDRLVRYHGIFAARAQGRARGHHGLVEAPTAPPSLRRYGPRRPAVIIANTPLVQIEYLTRSRALWSMR